MKMQHILSKVNILAAQIRKATGNKSRSDSMRTAWGIIKTTPDAKVVTFFKMSTQTLETRVVLERLYDLQPPVGGHSNRKPGQILFADLGKWAAGKNCIISTYQENIRAKW